MTTLNYKIVNGRWVIGNLNDKMVKFRFDFFINIRRTFEDAPVIRTKKDLSIHNHKFKENER